MNKRIERARNYRAQSGTARRGGQQCNYQDNYYGDQVCRVVDKA